MSTRCVYCLDAPAVEGGLGSCGRCYWAIKGEAVEGIWQLEQYLAHWARFAAWCAAHHPA